jgi:hypothetical protein
MPTLVNRYIVTSSCDPLSAVTSTTNYVMQERRAVKSGEPLYDATYTVGDAARAAASRIIVCKSGGPLCSRAMNRYLKQHRRTIILCKSGGLYTQERHAAILVKSNDPSSGEPLRLDTKHYY